MCKIFHTVLSEKVFSFFAYYNTILILILQHVDFVNCFKTLLMSQFSPRYA